MWRYELGTWKCFIENKAECEAGNRDKEMVIQRLSVELHQGDKMSGTGDIE